MLLNKRFILSSVLLTATAVTIFTLHKNAEAIEICNNSGQDTVSAQVDSKNGESKITNASNNCAYKVGVASFRQTAKSKELYDVKYGIVKKNETLALNIEVPEGTYQYETFVGDLDNRENITTKDDSSENENPQPGTNAHEPVAQDDDRPRATISQPAPTPVATEAPTSVPTNTPTQAITPFATPTLVPTATATPAPTTTITATLTPVAESTPTAVPTPVYQIINNNNNTNNNTNEQRIIIEEGGRTREIVVEPGRGGYDEYYEYEEVLSTTDKGQPVYKAPKKINETPSTGPEALSLLTLIPTGIAGYLLRKRLQ